jgi:hypothetical protein
VKIESKKLEWNAAARTTNLNTNYVPGGGDKKVGSIRTTTYAFINVCILNLNSHE